MEKPNIDFEQMKREADIISSELEIPEYTLPEDASVSSAELSKETEVEAETLDGYISEKVFEELGLTDEVEKARITQLESEGASPERLEIERRSFANIRSTIRVYFQELVEDGVFDSDKITREDRERRSSSRDDIVRKEITENPQYEKFDELESLEDVKNEWNRLKKEREKTEIALGVNTFMSEEEYTAITSKSFKWAAINEDMKLLQAVIDKVTLWSVVENTNNEIGQALAENDQQTEQDIAQERVRITREAAMEALQIAIAEVSIHHEVTLNLHPGALEKIAESGQIVSSASLDREHLEDLAKAISETSHDRRYKDSFSAENYMRMRAEAEKQLDLEPGTIIYGAISTDDEPLGHTGYGECCLVFNKAVLPDITFTEGDSLSLRNRGFYSRKDGVIAEQIRRGSQLSFEHALISQAVTRAFHAIERGLLDGYDSDDYMEYLEAKISTPIPFDSAHIAEIRFGESVDVEAFQGTGIPIRIVKS